MNELEHHRKRAKHLVRQHRAGVHVVAERLRRALPQYRGRSDHEVLAADFALHDAHQVIAVELGFGSWAELREAPAMSTSTTTTPLRHDRALAQLFVTDFDRAIAFYRDVLGFEVVFAYGDPAFYGQVSRDDAAFNLRFVDDSPWLPEVRERGQLLAVSITVTNVKELFLAYEAGDVVEFQERLREKPWGATEFVVRDPDGNLILFSSPTS